MSNETFYATISWDGYIDENRRNRFANDPREAERNAEQFWRNVWQAAQQRYSQEQQRYALRELCAELQQHRRTFEYFCISKRLKFWIFNFFIKILIN